MSHEDRWKRLYLGDWAPPEPTHRPWMDDPAGVPDEHLADLLDREQFPLRVIKHRERFDIVHVVVGANGGWVAEVRDMRIAYWIVRTANAHWMDQMQAEQEASP